MTSHTTRAAGAPAETPGDTGTGNTPQGAHGAVEGREEATEGYATIPPRTWTPERRNGNGSTTITMKRACNGCGRQLGDVTDQEMARGINQLPLPDVRRECPDCAPTAPEPKCLPTVVLLGEPECLDVECGHEHSAEGGPDPIEDSYCDEVTEHAICITHSEIDRDGAITRAAPWPCQHTKTTAEGAPA